MLNLVGYHGTSKENGEVILSTRKFRIAGTFRDWLGKGAYFFENDRHQAYMFYKFKDRNNVLEHDKICVIGACLNAEVCIDLLCDEDRNFIKEYAKKLKQVIKNKEKEIGKWKHKEGFVLDMLYRSSPYDFVRAAYMVPKQSKDAICEFEPIQIQICVKNIDCIDKESICEVNCNDYK